MVALGVPAEDDEGDAASPVEGQLSLADKGRINALNKAEHAFKGDQAHNEWWGNVDVNNNGIVSLSEVGVWVQRKFPKICFMPALQRAYVETTTGKGTDDDGFIQKQEFSEFVGNLFFFLRMYLTFEKMDTTADRRIGRAEFLKFMQDMSAHVTAEVEEKVFDSRNHITFAEMCERARKLHLTELLGVETHQLPVTQNDVLGHESSF